ncbi:MAG TPA: polyhydroxyalkanoate synthesis repressor PhaR [Woeseiaceae bacterium]|nr:polyhydroxyalkanoate synthesis repressor PhaR [Woeseiaceae bacterium]
MPETRVIKKYPNRRLYDTEESRYIRLSDVRELVLNDIPFVVLDKRNGNDITRSILLQVIAEEEQAREPVMSCAFLSQVIRLYGRVPAAATAGYLEQCLETYLARGRSVAQVHPARWSGPHDEAPATVGDDSESSPSRAGELRFAEDRKRVG